MPIWLRKYTFSEIDKYYKEEKSAYDNAQNGGKGTKNLINADGKVNTPAFAEASKPYKGKTSYK
jgi:hypothetical protein|tara:strand:- start:2439 stop:2630 length:192 start_codon:yes stop_codon:yes gene_type:complete